MAGKLRNLTKISLQESGIVTIAYGGEVVIKTLNKLTNTAVKWIGKGTSIPHSTAYEECDGLEVTTYLSHFQIRP